MLAVKYLPHARAVLAQLIGLTDLSIGFLLTVFWYYGKSLIKGEEILIVLLRILTSVKSIIN